MTTKKAGDKMKAAKEKLGVGWVDLGGVYVHERGGCLISVSRFFDAPNEWGWKITQPENMPVDPQLGIKFVRSQDGHKAPIYAMDAAVYHFSEWGLGDVRYWEGWRRPV